MDQLENLRTIAEVATAFAGFTGVVVVLGRRSSGTWSAAERSTIRILLESSIGVVLFALLPAIIAVGGIAAEKPTEQVIDAKFELFVNDPAESTAFYSLLGFEVAHAKAHGYTTVKSGSTVIALSPLPWWLPLHWLGFLRHPPLGTEIVLYVANLEQSQASLERAGHSPGAISLQPWGDRDFRVTDPDGYYVRVSEGTAVPLDPSLARRPTRHCADAPQRAPIVFGSLGRLPRFGHVHAIRQRARSRAPGPRDGSAGWDAVP